MTKLKILPALLLLVVLARCTSTQPISTETDPPVTTVVDTTATEVDTPDTAPATRPDDWFHLDPEEGYRGAGTARAYHTLLNGKEPRQTVIVAVIDSGIDIDHEDLQGHIWTNDDELAGNGTDDDQNGYVDDTHGWNFIGGRDGAHVQYDTYELTREFVKLSAKYQDVDPADVPEDEQQAYQYYQEVRADFDQEVQNTQQQFANVDGFLVALKQADEILKAHLNVNAITPDVLETVDESQEMLARAKGIFTFLFDNELTIEELEEYHESLQVDLDYRYSTDFDPRSIVGDNYDDTSERLYGNRDVEGPDAEHGTHVAGIIAADRNNDLGPRGIAGAAQIMVLRTVPDGDERDKDVANAIRYAVDNGAHIINMSFGKSYSPQKAVVDDAVRYADNKGVLMVHASGNDGEDLDSVPNFPTRTFLDGQQAANWLEIGATSWKGDHQFAASFSNYGKHSVDLFAPGVDIYSTLPDQAYGERDGTSMAAPVVTGVAALIMSYYPDLTATQVRDILLQTATPYPDQEVLVPGTQDRVTPFGQLSVTGSVVNAYAALKMAEVWSH
ncbi:MAG: S8 family peptidase [Rhodothermales bacterium]